VLAHNVETVPRIFKRIRPAFRYERSLDVLTRRRAAGLVTKSNLILGMGETPRRSSRPCTTCTTPGASC
jgi:lipoic acid synthetase